MLFPHDSSVNSHRLHSEISRHTVSLDVEVLDDLHHSAFDPSAIVATCLAKSLENFYNVEAVKKT